MKTSETSKGIDVNNYIPQLQDRLMYDDGTMPVEDGQPMSEWLPEDFNFVCVRPERRDIFVNGKYELRRFEHDNWLLRKKTKNKKGNSEMLVKFYFVIKPEEALFANGLFTLGLR